MKEKPEDYDPNRVNTEKVRTVIDDLKSGMLEHSLSKSDCKKLIKLTDTEIESLKKDVFKKDMHNGFTRFYYLELQYIKNFIESRNRNLQLPSTENIYQNLARFIENTKPLINAPFKEEILDLSKKNSIDMKIKDNDFMTPDISFPVEQYKIEQFIGHIRDFLAPKPECNIYNVHWYLLAITKDKVLSGSLKLAFSCWFPKMFATFLIEEPLIETNLEVNVKIRKNLMYMFDLYSYGMFMHKDELKIQELNSQGPLRFFSFSAFINILKETFIQIQFLKNIIENEYKKGTVQKVDVDSLSNLMIKHKQG